MVGAAWVWGPPIVLASPTHWLTPMRLLTKGCWAESEPWVTNRV